VGNIRYDDRLLTVELRATPVNVIVTRICLPTSEYDDEIIDNLYDENRRDHQYWKYGEDYVVM